MSRLRKIVSILILTIILSLSIYTNVFAAGGSHWYDYNDNDWFMGQDINDLAGELCGKKLSFGGEGSIANFPPNVGCIDPNTGLGGGSANFMCGGIIDITRRYR